MLLLNVHVWCAFGGSYKKKKTRSSGLSSLPDRQYAFYPHMAYGQLRNLTKNDTVSWDKFSFARVPSDPLEVSVSGLLLE